MQVDQQNKRARVAERTSAVRMRAQLDAPRRRTFRPDNDNVLPIARMLERGAFVLVPVIVFLLLAFAVISAV